MGWQSSPYASALLATTVFLLAAAFVAGQRRATRNGPALAALLIAIAEWTALAALEIMAPDLPTKIVFSKIGFAGTLAAPVLWFIFVMIYVQDERCLKPVRLALTWLLPAFTLVMTITNERHGLVWSSITLNPAGPGHAAVYEHGPLFWLTTAYMYVLLAVAAFMLWRAAERSVGVYRRQALALLAAAGVPWLANVVYITRLVAVPGLDLTPLAFALSALITALSIFRFQFLDLVPAARDAVIDSISDGVIVFDPGDRIVDINPAAQSYIGAPAERLVGRPAGVALGGLPPELAEYRTLSEARGEVRLDGAAPRYLDVCISPLHDRRGRVTGRSLVFRDVTERKQVEAALQGAKEAFEHTNAELACRLEELNAANADLQAQNAELETFAHTVAHDLKSPLAQVRGFAEILATDAGLLEESEVAEALQFILKTSTKMNSIIEELLLLAEVRKAGVKLAPLDMGPIVQEVLGRLEQQVRARDAQVIVPNAWPRALGYAPWVEQVWFNYIGNALKYGGRPDLTPPIPPCLELGSESAGGTVRFWVRDNGRGLTTQEMARLFAPFERLSQARGKGHGLGLSIVRRIVEKLGGQAGVESEVGVGSVFSFTLNSPPA